MSGKITVKYLQEYIKSKDFHSDFKDYYFKLTEEVGELSRAIRKNLRPADKSQIKETIEEELWDVMYYVITLANCYNIDLEEAIKKKEEVNNERYHPGLHFDPK